MKITLIHTIQTDVKTFLSMIAFLFNVIFFSACNTNSQSNTSLKSTKQKESKKCAFNHCEINFKDCISKALYVLNEVDMTTYDSVASFYFEEVKDYTDEAAIALLSQIKLIQHELVSNASNTSVNDSLKVVQRQLKSNLVQFEKKRTGFIFVHTFINKSDTLSAIILVNDDGTNSEAILVKTVTNIDVSQYFDDVYSLNSK